MIGWNWIAALVISAAVSLVFRPKTPSAKPGEVQIPVAEEGRRARRVYGTVWIDDPQQLAFKRVGVDRIRKSGGKK